MLNKPEIAIIGAGISGLSTAYWLQQKGFEVTLLEKGDRVGGSIVTEKEDGFLIDLGPNSALETSEVLKDLIRELGLADQKVYGNEASDNRYVVRDGILHPLPMSPIKFLRTKLFSTHAKLRLMKEPFIKPTDGRDLSLADFVRYRLGEEFLDYAINPFVAGVYAGDPENLSTAAGFPKLYALEQNYGSFIKGAVKGARERKKRKEVAKDRARLFSFIDGMSVFPETIAEKLGQRVRLNCAVTALNKVEDGFELKGIENGDNFSRQFEKVVLSVPAFAMADILSIIDQERRKRISEIYYPPVTVVFTGFRQEAVKRTLDGFGFLIPRVENRKILGSIWSSTIFPGRAPEGFVAFTTFVGGVRQPEIAGLEDRELVQLVINELDSFLVLDDEPVITRIKRWPRAIPQYEVGYKEVQKIFDDLEAEYPGLYIAGNCRRGISLGDSVLGAYETVGKIVENSN